VGDKALDDLQWSTTDGGDRSADDRPPVVRAPDDVTPRRTRLENYNHGRNVRALHLPVAGLPYRRSTASGRVGSGSLGVERVRGPVESLASSWRDVRPGPTGQGPDQGPIGER